MTHKLNSKFNIKLGKKFIGRLRRFIIKGNKNAFSVSITLFWTHLNWKRSLPKSQDKIINFINFFRIVKTKLWTDSPKMSIVWFFVGFSLWWFRLVSGTFSNPKILKLKNLMKSFSTPKILFEKYQKSTRSFHKPTRKFRPADFTEFSNITYRQRNNTAVNGSINDGQEKTEFLSKYVTYLDLIPRIFWDLESP